VWGAINRKYIRELLWEDKPEAKSKTQEELSLIMQPMGITPG
jgi:hypothetical protein